MSTRSPAPFELSIRRHFQAPRARIWECWTRPDLLKQWFCPLPWRVSEAEMSLHPGGRFRTVMAGPNGEIIDNPGVFLDVQPGSTLVFTDAFQEGFIPHGTPFMVGFVHLEDAADGGTSMHWGARHWTQEAHDQHLAMGFEAGWNAAADQLDQLARLGRVGPAQS